MQERIELPEPLFSQEKAAIKSLRYWQNIAANDADAKVRGDARNYVIIYEEEVAWFDGARDRMIQRRVRATARAPLPPLTLFEMACAPMYVAQLCFEGLFVGMLWLFIIALVYAFLFGG